jgi:hypothetical protein
VDLLIDRKDGIIKLCEMKFANTEYVIDKKTDENLRNKKAIFTVDTKTRKAVHITMVTTYGVKRNEYWNNIQSEVTMNDLFGDYYSSQTLRYAPQCTIHLTTHRGSCTV